MCLLFLPSVSFSFSYCVTTETRPDETLLKLKHQFNRRIQRKVVPRDHFAVAPAMFSTFCMDDTDTKYVVPLDAIDLACLPLSISYGEDTVPLWSREKLDMYFEFEVLKVEKEHEPAVKETKPNEENLNITTYLKILHALTKTPQTLKLKAFDDDTFVIHIQNKKVYVSVNNFHGYVESGSETLCRLCRVVTGQKDVHMLSEKHMEIVTRHVNDVNCIRKVDQLWSHCILCNEIVESKEFHITCSSEHELRLRDALCSTPVTNNTIYHGTGNKSTSQSHVNGLPKDKAQNKNASSYITANHKQISQPNLNNVVSSYNMANHKQEPQTNMNNIVSSYNMVSHKQKSQPNMNNIVSSWARTSNNTNNRQSNFSMPQKMEKIPTNCKTECPNVTLKPGMVYCEKCDITLHFRTLLSHQGGYNHKINSTNFKKIEVQEATSNVTPKLVENIEDDSNVCVCGTVFISKRHKRSHLRAKTHQDYLINEKIKDEKAKKASNNLKTVNAGNSNDFKKIEEKNATRAIDSAAPKPAEKIEDNSNVCICGTVFLNIHHKKTHFSAKTHQDYLIKQKIEDETTKKASNNLKTVNAGNTNDKNIFNCQSNIKIEKQYCKIPNRQVFCNVCNFKMHENDLQSHLKGRNHAENAIYAQGITVQNTKTITSVINNLAQNLEAVDERAPVTIERNNETKDPYEISATLITNILKGNVDDKASFPEKAILIGKNQEEPNTEQAVKIVDINDINTVVTQDVFANTTEHVTASYDEPKPSGSKEHLHDMEATTVIPASLEKLVVSQESKALDKDPNEKPLIECAHLEKTSTKQDISNNNTGLMKNCTEITLEDTEMAQIDTKITQNDTEMTNEKPLNRIASANLEKTSTKQDIANNITGLMKNCTEITLEDTELAQNDTKITQNDTEMTNEKPLNRIKSANLEKTSTKQGISNNITGSMKNCTEITLEDTEMAQIDTKIIQNYTESTKTETEMTERGTLMTPEEPPVVESAKETSIKRNNLTDKIRNLFKQTREGNKKDTFDENLFTYKSVFVSEVSEDNKPAIKQDKKLNLVGRLRKFVARKSAMRAKRKNTNSED